MKIRLKEQNVIWYFKFAQESTKTASYKIYGFSP
jgi:hypothetical protein